jgi:hypothetical protein
LGTVFPPLWAPCLCLKGFKLSFSHENEGLYGLALVFCLSHDYDPGGVISRL